MRRIPEPACDEVRFFRAGDVEYCDAARHTYLPLASRDAATFS